MSAPASYRPFEGTREAWCLRILDVLTRELRGLGIEMVGDRQVRVAVTPLPASKLGLCHSSNGSGDGRTNFIDVSTVQADPAELVHTLLHELLHAFDDLQSGHRNRWKRWAAAVGIEAVGHKRSPVATRMIERALAEVGIPAAHVTSVRRRATAGSAVPSQVRVRCPQCREHAYIPRGAMERGFATSCAAHGMRMEVDQ